MLWKRALNLRALKIRGESEVEDVEPLFHADNVLVGKDFTKDGTVSPDEERPMLGQSKKIVFREEIEKILEKGPGDDIHFIELKLNDVYGAASDCYFSPQEHRHFIPFRIHLQEMDPVDALLAHE